MSDEIKAGDLFILSSGAYSDYGIAGLWRALRDFKMVEQQKRYVQQQPKPEWADRRFNYVDSDSAFGSWLETEGFAEELSYVEHYTDQDTWPYEELFGEEEPEA